jgi:hypothetical protein
MIIRVITFGWKESRIQYIHAIVELNGDADQPTQKAVLYKSA